MGYIPPRPKKVMNEDGSETVHYPGLLKPKEGEDGFHDASRDILP